jgi:nucleotide-binding universal stress UspA family protein
VMRERRKERKRERERWNISLFFFFFFFCISHLITSSPRNNTITTTMTRKIVVCLESSACSETAFQFAIEKLIVSGDEVILLFVRTEVAELFPAGNVPAATLEEIRTTAEKHAKELEQKYQKKVSERGINATSLTLVGDPRDVIERETKRIQPDFVVVGSHGAGAINHLVLHSVSDYLVHHCPAAVVVVKHK